LKYEEKGEIFMDKRGGYFLKKMRSLFFADFKNKVRV
jgi:hypothetical protein